MAFDGDLVRSTVEPIVLQLLDEQAMYGYQIIKVVNERTHGAFEWKEGTLYPCLHRLEGEGLIFGDWQTAANGRRRKYYGITLKGQAVLRKKAAEWRQFSLAVNALLFSTAGG